MAEQDALRDSDWSKLTKAGLYLKFEAGKPVVLRVLTTDPVVVNSSFIGDDGEEVVTTRFAFIVYNFTQEKPQILQATPNMAKKISDIHNDDDFGGNIREVDIKISPTGEKLQRKYDIMVLPKAQELTNAMVREASKIDLEEKVKGDRMSVYDPAKYENKTIDSDGKTADDDSEKPTEEDDQEPIKLDDIPF